MSVSFSVADLEQQVDAFLSPSLPPHSRLILGLSGGLDSVVLLHLLHRIASRHDWRLQALHVHHGISAQADAWAAFCQALCQRWRIPLQLARIELGVLRATHGIEAAARQRRYAAFAAADGDALLLAHHADDQAETLLLQLLRGAGVAGVAAMPLRTPAQGGLPPILRPLLGVSRQRLLDYAETHGLEWVEDDSNFDLHHPRNFLRHRVMPLLAEKFPAYRETLARSARHFADASELLDDLADADGASAIHGELLDVAVLCNLAPARQKNLLRRFLHLRGAPPPQAVQLGEMLQQLCHARQDAAVCVQWADWQVRRFRRQAYVLPLPDAFDPHLRHPWNGETEVFWSPLHKRITFQAATGEGISRQRLQMAPVTLRLRQGGATLRVGGHARSLKQLYQQHAIPPWQRAGWPLLYSGETLVAVAGLAVADEWRAQEGEISCKLAVS